ncbi:MAG: LLM class flavin-dependent oxidoreductase [Gemmatimonadales bacterium]|nr:MAG: LLM class flavin-dependent oxidoreductase [Gemmatimonadales bacterium]
MTFPDPDMSMKPLDLGIFFFASSEGGDDARDGYRLILEAARFADRRGFASLWMPERHFHAFGGLSPNPALLAATLATHTERISLRSGSVVVPLHHPARIVEEWSVVDQLSGGRVELGVAAGWFPDDFVLVDGGYEERKDTLVERIHEIRALWRGEPLRAVNGMGDEVSVRTVPRPVQAEIPIWLTAAMSPDSFRQAGTLGTHILTHLLFQGIDQLAERIQEYRAAWREAGHPGEGQVSVMVHTHVTDHDEGIRELVRGPMKQYLGSSVSLAHRYLQSLPIFRDNPELTVEGLSPEAVDTALEYSFERYFRTSGLFGAPESCLPLLARLSSIGVDEVGCLVDFGLPVDQVLAALEPLDRLRKLAAEPTELAASIAGPPTREPLGYASPLPVGTATSTREPAAGGAGVPDTRLGDGSATRLATASTPAAAEMEAVLSGVWSELLEQDRVDVETNFFELGAHSLLAVRAVEQIRERTGHTVEVVDLFRFPTVRSLAQHLAGDGDAEEEGMEEARARAARRRGGRPGADRRARR